MDNHHNRLNLTPVITSHTGFLAATPEEYAQTLSLVFTGAAFDAKAEQQMREHARLSVKRFSDQAFIDTFSSLWATACP